jgi:hypothetical protein
MGRSVVAMVGPAATGWLLNGAPFLAAHGSHGGGLRCRRQRRLRADDDTVQLRHPRSVQHAPDAESAEPRVVHTQAGLLRQCGPAMTRSHAKSSKFSTVPRQRGRRHGADLHLRAGNRSQNRDFLLNSDFAARYFNTVPKRAALARIPVRLFERGSLVWLAQHIGIRTRNEFSQLQHHGHGGAHPALGVGLMEQQQLQQHTTTTATNRLIGRTA